MSGNLEQLLLEDGVDPKTFPPTVERVVGAAAINIGKVRNLGLSVDHEKTEENWYHGSVRGYSSVGNQRQKKQRELRNIAVAFIDIDQEEAKKLYDIAQAEKVREAALKAPKTFDI